MAAATFPVAAAILLVLVSCATSEVHEGLSGQEQEELLNLLRSLTEKNNRQEEPQSPISSNQLNKRKHVGDGQVRHQEAKAETDDHGGDDNHDDSLRKTLDDYLRDLPNRLLKSRTGVWLDTGGVLDTSLDHQPSSSEDTKDAPPLSTLEEEAHDWMNTFSSEYTRRQHLIAVAGWNYETNLTQENADKYDEVDVDTTQWLQSELPQARDYLDMSHDFKDKELVRMFIRAVYGEKTPPSKQPEIMQSITSLKSEMEGIYGNAEVEHDGKVYKLNPNLTEIMDKSRDYDERLWAWLGWRDVTGPRMMESYTELVRDENIAARENGYSDVGQSWRIANFEEDDSLVELVDQKWREVKPLYKQLFTFVRSKVRLKYPDANIAADGPIPAHLLGDMWSQEWGNMQDYVLPYPDVTEYDVTHAMLDQDYTVHDMFTLTERFFTSLGLDPMTSEFWQHSMLVRPDDRPVQCHGSATDFYTGTDFRIKMCTSVNQVDLFTIHHEMGHIVYFMEYSQQPGVLRSGANSAFHEAIGDTMSLSAMTSQHLRTVGLLTGSQAKDAHAPIDEHDINFLMRLALDKIAFLPFGYMVDKWRWAVFNGSITEEDYNTKWWEYRTRYQGVVAPVERGPNDFDPGAKFHIPANVPYIRYFISFIIQFQFHEALCDAAGHQGPLHRCDIYNSKQAGKLLRGVLSLGSSRHWRDVMEIFTGSKEVKTDAIYRYFQPLLDHLKDVNQDEYIGWR